MLFDRSSLRTRMLGLGRSHSKDADPTTFDRLSMLLRHNEAAFTSMFDSLNASSKKQLARDDAPHALLPSALMLDKADAVMAMRPYATSSKRSATQPDGDARLVSHARETKQPRLTEALYMANLLDRSALTLAVRHAQPDVLIAFVAAKRVPQDILADVLPSFVNRLPEATLRTWVQDGSINIDQYCRVVCPDRTHAQGTALLLQSAIGELDIEHVLDYLAPSLDQMLMWLQEGTLPFEALLRRCPTLEHETVRHLWTAKLIDDDQYFYSGRATEQELDGFVERQNYTAAQCMERYTISETLAGVWFAFGYVHEQVLMRHRGTHWQLKDPLPVLHRLQAARAADIHTTLSTLPLPADKALRRSLRAGLYATWIEAQLPAAVDPKIGGYAWLGGASKAVWDAFRSIKQTALGEAELPDPAAECFACTDVFDGGSPAVTFSNCHHAPLLHAECLRADFDSRVAQGFAPRCPVSDCGVRPTLADADKLGFDGKQREALALSIIHGYRTPNWIPCPTRGCISGADIASGAVLSRRCVFCELPVTLRNLTAEVREMKDLALLMIRSMQDQGAGTTTRPCYHCGTATTRTAGCNTMTCGRDAHSDERIHGCGQTWDFRTGQQVNDGQSYGQAYVPRSGMLLRAGLYAPLRPGYIHRVGERLPGGHATLQALVISNARAMGWYAEA